MKMYLYITVFAAVGLLSLSVLGGCGSSNSDAPVFLGTHPLGWENPLVHGPSYVLKPEQCTECHGKDLRGGISKADCISCHWQDPANQKVHIPMPDPAFPASSPQSWELVHGRYAKLAPGGGAFTGFVSCRNCHGGEFTGTILSDDASCINVSCHKMVGYPDLPPHSGSWNDPFNFIGAKHWTTDPANASVCFQCHNREQGPHIWLDGTAQPTDIIPNLLTPSTGNPDPLAAPGCFNNTLCHGPMP